MACATLCSVDGCFCVSGVDMELVRGQGCFTCDSSRHCWCMVFSTVGAVVHIMYGR